MSYVLSDAWTWDMWFADDGDLYHAFYLKASPDLYNWTKAGSEALCEAEPQWYEKFDGVSWPDEAWRDPWVFAHDGRWHMLVTARSNHGAPDDRGVIGHATSPDLDTWTVQPPLSQSGAGFGHLEVPQIASIGDRDVLIFSSLYGELTVARRESGERGGVWSVPVESPTGPYDITKATRLTDESLYAGRLLQDRDGAWWLFAFNNVDENRAFIGSLSDPLPVGWGGNGRLRVTDGRFDHLG